MKQWLVLNVFSCIKGMKRSPFIQNHKNTKLKCAFEEYLQLFAGGFEIALPVGFCGFRTAEKVK